MIEIRCVKCKRLLMKANHFEGEIKCPKCGYTNKIYAFNHTVSYVEDNKIKVSITEGGNRLNFLPLNS